MKTLSRGTSFTLAAIVITVLVTGSWFVLLPEPAQAAVLYGDYDRGHPGSSRARRPRRAALGHQLGQRDPGGSGHHQLRHPGAGPHKISPAAPLPAIVDAVTIDGYTQPGAMPPGPGPAIILIELDGTLAGPRRRSQTTTGRARTRVVKGLAINRFSQNGIFLQGALGTTVEGCHIGTDVIGAVPLPNAWSGIAILGRRQR